MRLRGLVEEDFTNYKKPSMFLIVPFCTFKCDKEYGTQICQNLPVTKEPIVEISNEDIYKRYVENPITKAFVFGGLEPFYEDTFEELYNFINFLRWDMNCFDDVVIYTGYDADECIEEWSRLSKFSNVIVKFGRYIPNQKPHFDDLLGVNLSSDNQYAEEL